MKRAAVVAHYDAQGEAAPHFLRLLDQLSATFDVVVVASPSDLTDEAITAISDRALLLRRTNYGHDFGSWRDALERMDWAEDFDELLLTNDSYVGFLRPLDQIMLEMARTPHEVWGMTKSWRHSEHVQSYFLYFSRSALRSRAFRSFWMDAKPATSRMSAILEQEVGISAVMREAGFSLGSYFTPTTAERRRATRRGVHWLRRRRREFPARFDTLEDTYFDAALQADPGQADFLNWSSAFADSSLDAGRLPVVKFDTLRYDPYWLDAGHLLSELEKSYPAAMSGVRDYIERTAHAYSRRRYENHGTTRLGPLERVRVGYTRRRPLLGGPSA